MCILFGCRMVGTIGPSLGSNMRHTYRDTSGRFIPVPRPLAAFYAFAAVMGTVAASILFICTAGR